jgi:hypothetical protein
MPKGLAPPFLTKLIVYREGLKHTAHGVKITLGLVFWGLGSGLGCWRAVLPLLLSIRPPILSICPPILSVFPSILSTFDAGLVAGAGGEKRAGRSGCQDEQERSCDPLSGDGG